MRDAYNGRLIVETAVGKIGSQVELRPQARRDALCAIRRACEEAEENGWRRDCEEAQVIVTEKVNEAISPSRWRQQITSLYRANCVYRPCLTTRQPRT